MPYSRQRPRLPLNQRITARFTTVQRDILLHSSSLDQKLGYGLHHAPVRGGKLSLRATKAELEKLIAAAANVSPNGPDQDRLLRALLRYLETLEDRFEDAEPSENSDDAPDDDPSSV